MIKFTEAEDPKKSQLDELKKQWDNEWQRNQALEGKAVTIIQVSSTVTTLVFGFVTLSKSLASFTFNPILQTIIILGIIFSISSIITSILALRTYRYIVPLNIDQFFRKNDYGAPIVDISNVDQIKSKKPEEFLDMSVLDKAKDNFITNYVISIKSYNFNNANKAILLILSLVLLIISIGVISLAVGVIFLQQSGTESPIKGGQFSCSEIDVSNTRIIKNNQIIQHITNDRGKVILCFQPTSNSSDLNAS